MLFIIMEKTVDAILNKKKIKPTAMRQLVLDVLLKKQSAISLFEIEQQFENVERSTIYRTLKIFQQNCIIHKVDDGTGAVKYALCTDGCTCSVEDLHVHFLCIDCGETTCLKDIPVPDLSLPENFHFNSANFVVKGICAVCN